MNTQLMIITTIFAVFFGTIILYLAYLKVTYFLTKRKAERNPDNIINKKPVLRTIYPPEKYKFTEEYVKQRLEERNRFDSTDYKKERRDFEQEERVWLNRISHQHPNIG